MLCFADLSNSLSDDKILALPKLEAFGDQKIWFSLWQDWFLSHHRFEEGYVGKQPVVRQNIVRSAGKKNTRKAYIRALTAAIKLRQCQTLWSQSINQSRQQILLSTLNFSFKAYKTLWEKRRKYYLLEFFYNILNRLEIVKKIFFHNILKKARFEFKIKALKALVWHLSRVPM